MSNNKQNIAAPIYEHKLKIRLMEESFGVCRLKPSQPVPDWAFRSEFYSITKTTEELSLVCAQSVIPKEVTCEPDWRSFKIEGPLDFSLIGILSAISTALAKQKISIFAISTYDTDYILVKERDTADAAEVLTKEGYTILR